MPRVSIAKSTATRSATPTISTFTAASTSNHEFQPPALPHLIEVKNTGIASHNITVVTPGTVEGLAISDLVITIPVGTVHLPPFTTNFIDPTTGLVSINIEPADVADLSFAAILLGQG